MQHRVLQSTGTEGKKGLGEQAVEIATLRYAHHNRKDRVAVTLREDVVEKVCYVKKSVSFPSQEPFFLIRLKVPVQVWPSDPLKHLN